MRLYTTPKGQWAGTQADAKKLGAYVEYDVPTNKADLLVFLNNSCCLSILYTFAPNRHNTAVW